MEGFTAPDLELARLLVQRGVALVYALAFLNVLVEWRPLLGDDGLLPVRRFVARAPFRRTPSLFHRWPSDRAALVSGWLGLIGALALLSGVVTAAPTWVSMLVWALLWVLYLSHVNVGQIFYGFGWESILLEAGFLATFLGSTDVAPPTLTLLLVRWLVFRVEFGAGLIKMRGDQCWRDLTCLDYHHETQPLPGPLSRRFHRTPTWVHRMETGANHVVQLVVPFGLFLPQPVAGIAATAIIVTQGWLMVSGNFAWLNLVTIVLATSALPDGWFDGLAPSLAAAPVEGTPVAFMVVVGVVFVATVVASWWPVRNMASRRQRMNTAFNPFHLVGSYGAFGSVTRRRDEVVIEGSMAEDPDDEDGWREYQFWGKPGEVDRRPPQVAPYHLRLDWLLWFAALDPAPTRHRWFTQLLDALRRGDPLIRRLVRVDPFDGAAPRWLRVRRFRYRYTTRDERRATGDTWHRVLLGVEVGPQPGGS